jgi:hypothetical protein
MNHQLQVRIFCRLNFHVTFRLSLWAEGVLIIKASMLSKLDFHLNLRGWWLMPGRPPLISRFLGLSNCFPKVCLILLRLIVFRFLGWLFLVILPSWLLLDIVHYLIYNALYLVEIRIWWCMGHGVRIAIRWHILHFSMMFINPFPV